MLIFTERLPRNPDAVVTSTLALTAQERTRSRHSWETGDGGVVLLRLPRGTVLSDGDLLQDESQRTLIRIIADPEPVLTVFAHTPLLLLRAAYHLGNRHIPIEITPTYLRLSPDSVLQGMLTHMGLEIKAEIVPFHPELGAYAYYHHPH